MANIDFNITYFKRLGSTALITFTSNRISNMEECSDFLPAPTPSVAGMKTLRNSYQSKQANYKQNPSKQNKQSRKFAYDDLIDGHIAWIAYAKPIIGSNTDLANRFGYPQNATRTEAEIPEGQPPKPTMTLTPNPGEIILVAKPYKQGRKLVFYNWQLSEDGGLTYNYLPAISNSCRRRVKLALGKTYQIRVAYATVAGEGIFSNYLEISLTGDMVGRVKKGKA